MKPALTLYLAAPRGFCAGVDRAIKIVEMALEKWGAPVYVRHEIVHNKFVVDGLRAKGAVFVEELSDCPDDRPVIFSAHGVPKSVPAEAARRQMIYVDATCPLVSKVHMEVHRASRKAQEVIMIGHAGHPEVEGTIGQYESPEAGMYLVEDEADVAALHVKDASHLHFVTQTTLSVDETKSVIAALQQQFPAIQGPRKDDICYATQNRQDAVRELAAQVDLFIVVGSRNSSNSNRLRELAERLGTTAYLVDDADQLQAEWLQGVATVGVTAGASAPEVLVQQVVARLQVIGGGEVCELGGKEEDVIFEVPQELRLD